MGNHCSNNQVVLYDISIIIIILIPTCVNTKSWLDVYLTWPFVFETPVSDWVQGRCASRRLVDWTFRQFPFLFLLAYTQEVNELSSDNYCCSDARHQVAPWHCNIRSSAWEAVTDGKKLLEDLTFPWRTRFSSQQFYVLPPRVLIERTGSKWIRLCTIAFIASACPGL